MTTELTYTEDMAWPRGQVIHRILVIEYHGNQPHAVYTDRNDFDFDYCRRDDTLYYHCSGGGGNRDEHEVHGLYEPVPPSGKIWTAPGIRLTRWESDARPKVPIDDEMLLSMGIVRLEEPLLLNGATTNPFEAGDENDGHMEYCSICDDHLPDDELCEHIYMPDGGEPVGAGSEEPSEPVRFAAFDWLASVEGWQNWGIWRRPSDASALKHIQRLLLSGEFERVRVASHCMENQFFESFDDADYDGQEDKWNACEAGLGWLTTLGPDTPAANAKTLAWILAWRLSRGERAKTAARKALITELESFATSSAESKRLLAALEIPGGKRADLDAVPMERIEAVLASERKEGANP